MNFRLISLVYCCCLLFTQAAEIKIVGLRSMTQGEAMSILGDRIALVKKKPATPSRASDVAFMLESLMRLQGYANAAVTGTVVGSGSIIQLDVSEGYRQYFGEIFLEGIDDKEQKKMIRLFTSNAQKRLLAFAQGAPFLEEDVAIGLSYLQQELQSNGYWVASAKEVKRTPQKNGDVDFMIQIVKGPRHLLKMPIISGEQGSVSSLLREKISKYQGLPATTANINSIRSDVETIYRKNGYADAKVLLSGQATNGSFQPEIAINLGKRYRVSDVTVIGLEKTKLSRVANRFADMKGEYYDATRTDKEIRKLLNTGAFQSVRWETETLADSDAIDAILQVKEGKARSFSSYAGFQTFEGPIIGARYSARNLLGNLWNFSGGLEITGRGILFDTRLVDPWFLDQDLTAGVRFFAVHRDLDVYQKFESGFSADMTWEMTDHDTLLLFAASSFVSISGAKIDEVDLGATSYNHNRVRLTWTHDERNNTVTPSDGWIFDTSGELGTVIGDENASYAKWEAHVTEYIPIKEVNHIALGARLGMIIPATTGELPIDLRYFLGGPGSVRSFPQRELGPRNSENIPRGGEAYWIANAEYVHQISGPLKAVAFTDVGTLSADFSSFDLSAFDVAVGLGIRLDLPIGPVRLEYGHNLTQDPGEPTGAFHFAIGVPF